MSKRTLSMLIAAVVCGAAASAQAGEPTPPPSATVSPTGQTYIPDPLPREQDDDRAHPTVRTQSPPNDPQLARRVRSGFEEDRETPAAKTSDPVDYAEQPIAAEPFDDEVRVSETASVAMQDDDAPVEVRQVESDPFTDEAGSQGFSSGMTAQRARSQFGQLDADGSGSLSPDELEQSALAQRFEDYDINNDGEIAENEFQSWFAAVQPMRTDDRAIAADDDEQLDDD